MLDKAEVRHKAPETGRPIDGLMVGSSIAVGLMVLGGAALLMFSSDFAAAHQAMYDAMATMAEICRL